MKILLTRSGVATPLAETTELSSDGREPHSGKNTPALFLLFIWLRFLPERPPERMTFRRAAHSSSFSGGPTSS
jgi:hypothetical protein